MPNNNQKNTPPRRGPMGGGPQMAGEKAKDFKKSVGKLIGYLKVYRIPIIISIILSIISSIFAIIGPDRLKEITNIIISGIMTGIDMDKIKSIALFMGVIYSLSAIFDYIQGFMMATLANKFSYKLRKEISEKINRLPLKYFDKTSYGDVLSRVTNDVDTLGQTLNQSVSSLVSSITLLIGSIFMMFYTNWIMAITAILASLVGFALMMVIMVKSQKHFAALQKNLGDLNGHVEEIYSGHNVVKVYNGMTAAEQEFNEINERMYQSAKKSQYLSGLMQPIMSFIGNFGYVAVCVVGAMLTVNDIISFGVIVAFMVYIRLFMQPLTSIAQAATSLQSCAAASERVFEFLDEEEQPNEEHLKKCLDPKKVKGNIEFKQVKFSYNPEKEIIKNFTAKAKPGDKIAIVGPTGAGKTTMVNLLMKFYDILGGEIKIDGVPTKELTRENIHDLFIMVLQDTWVFEGSIKENIKYNKDNVSDEEVINACKIVGLHHYIKSLPKGYETILTDNDSLSAGQRQLLTIARGMTKDAPFLILDEATSSVDTRTEELVQKAMDKLTEGRTSFIIAHRLSTIKNADLILVMNEGNIIEQGDHQELLDKQGFYAELYNSQFTRIE